MSACEYRTAECEDLECCWVGEPMQQMDLLMEMAFRVAAALGAAGCATRAWRGASTIAQPSVERVIDTTGAATAFNAPTWQIAFKEVRRTKLRRRHFASHRGSHARRAIVPASYPSGTS